MTTPFISRITCPILAFYGSEEDWCGTDRDLDIVRHNARRAAYVDSVIIEGADHVYWGKAEAVASLMAGWVNEVRAADNVMAA
jgi:dienelactone hydrolase